MESYMVIFVEIYVYYSVLYLLENCHRLYFSKVESYVYYEFIFITEVYLKRFMTTFIRTFTEP